MRTWFVQVLLYLCCLFPSASCLYKSPPFQMFSLRTPWYLIFCFIFVFVPDSLLVLDMTLLSSLFSSPFCCIAGLHHILFFTCLYNW
uniref:Uncharacterized protein n=1 Tax=Populus trichocarpa TaxID=3694 RepID=A0A3N7FCF5_POPTR